LKILIVQNKMIGDVLTTSILFEALKSNYPDSVLHYAINAHTLPVVLNNPFINKFVLITPQTEKNKIKFYKFLKTIEQERYDIVIDAYSKTSSNLISLFSRAKIKISKYKPYTFFLYTHPVKYVKSPVTNAGLAIENRLQLLQPINDALTKNIIKPKIYLTEKEIEQAKQMLTIKGLNLTTPILMISVLGSNESKSYPLLYMSKLIDFLVKKTDSQILFNYLPNQKTEAISIYTLCEEKTKSNITFDVFGKNIREFLAITQHCQALIGNEGGAINMAKALNVATFSIFSPWIEKKIWHTFKDNKNMAVHLNDFKPELFKDKSTKELKKNANLLYENFIPELIFPKLQAFLKFLSIPS
jgi:heptosyltransferase-2